MKPSVARKGKAVPSGKMAASRSRSRSSRNSSAPVAVPAQPSLPSQVQDVLARLKRAGTPHDRENLTRFGIAANKAFGVSVANVQKLAKQLGRNHELALALWETGWYEARLLCCFVDEPARVTPAQMDRWCREFDNWGVCDTVCFHLFDRTPHAWNKVEKWSKTNAEFTKRGGFSLLACLTLHDKGASDEMFVKGLALIEFAAGDDRNFVKKGISWALRLIGRRNSKLNVAAVALSQRLVASPEPAARWIGRGALKELTSPLVRRQLERRR